MTSILKVTEIQDPTNSNKAIEIDTSGRVLQPQRPFIHVIHNTDKNTYASAAVIGSGGELTVKESRGITHSSGVFTLPKAGLYQIQLSLISLTNGAGIYWRKNSTIQYRIGYTENSTGALWNTVAGTVLTECSASDTIDFTVQTATRIYGNTGTSGVGGINILFLG